MSRGSARPSKQFELLSLDESLAERSVSVEQRGAVYTKPEVVGFILDLIEYTPDRNLAEARILEPAFGKGDFVIPTIERLMASYGESTGRNVVEDLSDCIRAVELDQGAFDEGRKLILNALARHGVDPQSANALAAKWLKRGDFLLLQYDVSSFTHAAGNPPYVRQESIPDDLMARYRALYATIYDRADLYVPFIERSLTLLAEGGTLGFICANRWMKNKYGGPLREFVDNSFHLRAYVDMVGVPAFDADVIAYPAITVITKEVAGPTRVAHRPKLDARTLGELVEGLTGRKEIPAVGVIEKVSDGSDHWLLDIEVDKLALVRRLERSFPTLEEAGLRVGIGVASGNDKAFMAPWDEMDVEPDRKIKILNGKDIRSGKVEWVGLGMAQPWAAEGGLVDLARYPKFKAFMENRKAQIEKRHCVKGSPAKWYKTIDRIYPELVGKSKLLVPDIKGEAHFVYEPGGYYPHHNLYYIVPEVADSWDLLALKAVLMSGIARLFVEAYCVRMEGDFLRFQAQYLRKIRVPRWTDVPEDVRARLRKAGETGEDCQRDVCRLYGLSTKEGQILGNRQHFEEPQMSGFDEEYTNVYEPIIRAAVKAFWSDPAGPLAEESDADDDGEIRSGKTMDGFCHLIREILLRSGLRNPIILTSGNATTLPGYFRPSKKWDVTVYDEKSQDLIAAIEFKSMRRAFGKNFNNRVEEALGSASDLQYIYRLGKLRDRPKPFVGYVTLTAITAESCMLQREKRIRLGVDTELDGKSYEHRYDVLCKRLVASDLYTAAAVLRCRRQEGYLGHHQEVSPASGIRHFCEVMAAHCRKLALSLP